LKSNGLRAANKGETMQSNNVSNQTITRASAGASGRGVSLRQMVVGQTRGQLAFRVVLLLISVSVCALLLTNLVTAGPATSEKLDSASSPQGQSTLGDYVWHDTSLNGLPEGGEQGIDNVLVKLYLDDGDAIYEPGTGDTFQGQMVTGDDPNTSGTQHGWYDFNTTGLKGYWVVIDSSCHTSAHRELL
jgi:hypothetical protein